MATPIPIIADAEMMEFTTLIAAEDRAGLVQLRHTGTHEGRSITLLGQVSPAVARGIALDLLQAAEAADSDASLCRYCEGIGMPEDLVGQLISGIRNQRDDDDEGCVIDDE